MIIVGALWSRAGGTAATATIAGHGARAVANLLIALGTLVLSSGGLIQGIAGKDEAFVLSLALGISVIYAGFLVARPRAADSGQPGVELPPQQLARLVPRQLVDAPRRYVGTL